MSGPRHPSSRVLAAAVALLACAARPTPASGTERPPPASIRRATSAVKIDGVLDEPAWRDALRFDLRYEWFPGDNVEPPVRTEFLAAYDDDRLYVAWICHDPDPKAIRAHLMDRDQVDTFIQDDHVVLMLDPFNDERRGFQFRVNPLGVQMDAIFSENEGIEDFSYDMIWDSAGRIDEDGYVVEVAIPLSQLRFPRNAGPQTWGFDVGRSYPRSVRHRIVGYPKDRNKACVLCEVTKVEGFSGLTPGKNLEIAPTLTVSRSDALPEGGAPGDPVPAGPTKGDVGASLRWGVTPNFTLNAAANPDFSQVEADAAQLTVNRRFALFYPEKRPFFLEAIDLFTTPLQAVFSRTVVDPDWGLKFTGKEAKNAVGVFATRDVVNDVILPGSQFSQSAEVGGQVTGSTVRYRRDVGSNATVGALYAGREGDGYHNRVAGLDTFFRVGDSHRFQAQVLRSDTAYPDPFAAAYGQPQGAFDGWGWMAQYDLQSRNWFGEASYKDLGKDFRADSGFIPRVDVRNAQVQAGRAFWGTPETWYSRINVGVNGGRITDHAGTLLDGTGGFFVNCQGPMQSLLEIYAFRHREYFAPAGPASGVDHTGLDRVGLDGAVQPVDQLRLTWVVEDGGAVDYATNEDGREVFVNPAAEMKLGRHLNVQVDHKYDRLTAAGTERFTVNLSQLRVVYNISLRSFVRGIFQYQDLRVPPDPATGGRRFFYQLLFSYKLNPQTVAFVGYTDTAVGTPSVPMTGTDRTFFLKLGYVWSL